MTKYINLFITALLLVCVGCSSTQKAEDKTAQSKSPNIIYILADDLGYGDVQAFNPNGKIPTPNIDEMASNGVIFTDAHTSSSVCTPTRYGILTGRYNWRTSLKKHVLSGYSKSLIKQERTTIAEMLKQKGYSTAFIGKWHLGWDWDITQEDPDWDIDKLKALPKVNYNTPITNGPQSHGFDYSYGFCGSLDMPPYVYVENSKATMSPSRFTRSVDGKSFWRNGPTSDDFIHADVLQNITSKAVDYIGLKAKEKAPFFLYLPLPAPHTPILPSTQFLGKSNTNMYGDFVMQVDDVVRQIREVLKEKGIAENTLVVFTSDNGCSPTADFKELAKVEHNPSFVYRGTKADIYEGGHKVPFIVEWANGIKKQHTVNQTICTTDFFATCAELVGYQLKDNEGEDSYSMLSLIQGKENKDFRAYTVHHSVNGSFAIRQGDWKLILCAGSGGWSYPTPRQIQTKNLDLPSMQLYNLKDDIGETSNLIEKHPEKANELKRALAKIILDGRSTKGVTQQNEDMDNWTQIESIINVK